MPPACDVSCSAIPHEVWQHVLMFIPQKDRLHSCSLVCTKLHAAAVAASQCLTVALNPHSWVAGAPSRADAFTSWLHHHGSALTSMSLSGHRVRALRDLPCQHLQYLRLIECNLQLGAADGFPGVLPNCTTHLTRLVIRDCYVTDKIKNKVLGSMLARLVNLQQLSLGNMRFDVQGSAKKFPAQAFSKLQRLSYLKLQGFSTGKRFKHISSLQALQELHLDLSNCTRHTAPFHLPASLQSVSLTSGTRGNAPGSVLHAALLSMLMNVTSLQLGELTVHDGADFLAAMPALTQLRFLQMHNMRGQWPAASPAYGALTASSHLTQLSIGPCELPQGIWQHVFPPGRMLPHLCVVDMVQGDGFDGNASPAYALLPADLNGLVRSCPGLREMDCYLQNATSAAVLAELSHLTGLRLYFNGGQEHCVTCVPGLAGLTGLHHLQLEVREGLEGPSCDLLPLTALRQLTHLGARRMLWLQGEEVGVGKPIIAQYGSSVQRDVWRQLLSLCCDEADGDPRLTSALCSYVEQQDAHSAQQQDLLTTLQRRCARQQKVAFTLRQRCARQQELVAALRQRCAQQQQKLKQQRASTQQEMAVLQQQDSAARAEATELRQQLQALQNQVQVQPGGRQQV